MLQSKIIKKKESSSTSHKISTLKKLRIISSIPSSTFIYQSFLISKYYHYEDANRL